MERLFRFKQFSLSDKGSPMKIGTDAVLLGAWTSCEKSSRILDIGSGCGILALMLAQRSMAEILALEPEENAFLQAQKNFLNSPWAGRITIKKDRVQDILQNEPSRFDLIICNPPFFQNSLLSLDAGRNLARHNADLDQQELIQAVAGLGTADVSFSLILPAEQETGFENNAAVSDLFCTRKLKVRTFQNGGIVRVLLEFNRIAATTVIDEIVLRNDDGTYSESYRKLTGEYHPQF